MNHSANEIAFFRRSTKVIFKIYIRFFKNNYITFLYFLIFHRPPYCRCQWRPFHHGVQCQSASGLKFNVRKYCTVKAFISRFSVR